MPLNGDFVAIGPGDRGPAPSRLDGEAQALPWVSIPVLNIFPPNILGQGFFALS